MAVTSSGQRGSEEQEKSVTTVRTVPCPLTQRTSSEVTSHGLYAIHMTDLGKQRDDSCLLPVTRCCKNKPSPHPMRPFDLVPWVKSVCSHFGIQLHPQANSLFVLIGRQFYTSRNVAGYCHV